MSAPQQSLSWVKATASDSNGSCVEVARTADGGRLVRDSKDRGSGPVLSFTAAEWDAFLHGVKHDEFD